MSSRRYGVKAVPLFWYDGGKQSYICSIEKSKNKRKMA